MSGRGVFTGPNARVFVDGVRPHGPDKMTALGALGLSVLAHVVPFLLIVMLIGRVNTGTDLSAVAANLSARITWIPHAGGQSSGTDDGAGTRRQRTVSPSSGEFRARNSHSQRQTISHDPSAMYEIPVVSATAALDVPPGVLSPLTFAGPPDMTSTGGGARGSGGDAGGGNGGGGEGETGFGGDPFHVGNGVTSPVLIKEVKPAYTSEAMRARIQGTVTARVVVLPDGSVAAARIVRSLDPVFGLDREALRAVNLWRFKPGTRGGRPVPVSVDIELTFTLR